MKHIYTSPINGFDESGEVIHIYALESEDEYWHLLEYKDEWPELLPYEANSDFVDDVNPMPGAIYHRYAADLTGNHLIIKEYIAYNV